MRSDVDTFLARVGQPQFDYVEFNVPTDVELASRFPLIAHLLSRLAPAQPPERTA
jgi:hypothetical protein